MRGAYAHVMPSDALPDSAFAEDRINTAAIVNGSVALAAALESGVGPDRLVWREFSGAAKSPAVRRYPQQQARLEARDEMANKLRVSRDPCPRCGTRGDMPCRHNRVQRTINEYLTKPDLISEAWERELMQARKIGG